MLITIFSHLTSSFRSTLRSLSCLASVTLRDAERHLQVKEPSSILCHSSVPEAFRERLEYLRMSPEEQRAYDHYLDTLVRDTDVMKTKILEAEIKGRKEGLEQGMAQGMAQGMKEGLEQGMAQGRKEGMAQGQAEERLKNARCLKDNGVPIDVIVKSLGLTSEEIEAL